MTPEKEAHVKKQLFAFKWAVDDFGIWSHPAYGGGFDMFEAMWEEFTDLRQRVVAVEATIKHFTPAQVMKAKSVMKVPVSHQVGVELVKGTET